MDVGADLRGLLCWGCDGGVCMYLLQAGSRAGTPSAGPQGVTAASAAWTG